ncbi:hypothetical protein HGRIS_003764 [Hohenbuehelia grisea]|uniref:Cytochrome P450 n=1 Tax=Hohenbuehelia grisea TaxID=104357 RepID=A0ABR3JGR2_9AGAR
MIFSLLSCLLAIVPFGLVWAVCRQLRHIYRQRSLSNIPGPRSQSILTGNIGQIFNARGWGFHEAIAKQFGGVVRINGLFGDASLYVYDPKALHHIVLKDQDIYHETDLFIQGNRLIWGLGLLSTEGDHHKRQRKMINPVFSAAHMREMLPIFYEIAHQLQDTLSTKLESAPQEIDMLRWMSRTAVEIIGQSGLGYSFDSLKGDDAEHPYINVMKRLMPTLFSIPVARNLLPWFTNLGPASFRRAVVNLIPWKKLHDLRDMSDYMQKVSVQILESKRRAIEQGDDVVLQQVGRGKDILSILLRANLDASDTEKLPEEDVIGQIS